MSSPTVVEEKGSLWKPLSDPSAVHLGFVVGKVALGQDSLSTSVLPSAAFHQCSILISFTYFQHYLIIAIDRIITWNTSEYFFKTINLLLTFDVYHTAFFAQNNCFHLRHTPPTLHYLYALGPADGRVGTQQRYDIQIRKMYIIT
jgi:hypothetical protein